MADFFLVAEAADLAVGKPSLEHLPDTATVAEAISALQSHPDGQVSVWRCDRDKNFKDKSECACVGVVSKVDILCHLARDDNLENPERALQTRISELLQLPRPRKMPSVRHVEPKARLLDALAMMVDGAHYLVIPLDSRGWKKDKRSIPCAGKSGSQGHAQACANSGRGHCWLSQEDVVRYIFGCMGVFNPLPMTPVDDLGIIRSDVLKIDAAASARTALDLVKAAGEQSTAVAVVEEVRVRDVTRGHRLVGELSPLTMGCPDEALMFGSASALSVSDLLASAGTGVSPRSQLLELVRSRSSAADKLKVDAMSLTNGMERLMLGERLLDTPARSPDSSFTGAWEELSSEEEDDGNSGGSSPDGPFHPSLASNKLRVTPPKQLATQWSSTMVRRAPVTCRPWSSLAAVMAQALANRVSHMWVTDKQDMLVGVITFRDIIGLLLSELIALE